MDFPCGQCVYFDQQQKNGSKGVPVPKWYGFCSKTSVYQPREQEGQFFPPEAKRAASPDGVKLVVVQPTETRKQCHDGVKR